MSRKQLKLTGKPYEELIYKIYKEFEPHADVRLNDKIHGHDSQINREIDISIRYRLAGGHEILIIIQAKDHKKAADIKILGEFSSVIKDVRASKGILICSSGFTKTAKVFAKNQMIEICSAHDASSIDWASKIKIPMLKRKIIVEHSKLLMKINVTEEMFGKEFQINPSLKEDNGSYIDLYSFIGKKISQKEISLNEGVHEYEFKQKLRIDDNPIDSLIQKEHLAERAVLTYSIKHRYYVRYFTPDEYRGIQNFITDEFAVSYMRISDTSSVFSIIEDNSWKYVSSADVVNIGENYVLVQHVHVTSPFAKMNYAFFHAYWISRGNPTKLLNIAY